MEANLGVTGVARRKVLTVLAAFVAAACAGDSLSAPSAVTRTAGGLAHSTLSGPVTVQAATIGPNGQILIPPTSNQYVMCGAGTFTYGPGTITYTRECDTTSVQTNGYQPYDGGSVSVFIESPSLPNLHLGTFRANWTRLILHDLPTGAVLRMVAYPEAGTVFTSWTDYSQMFWTPSITRTVYAGDQFFAELQKTSGNGGGGGSGDPCIICP